jgi:hypothetical protein
VCPACRQRAISRADGASCVEVRPRRRARPASTPVCREIDPEATGSLGVRGGLSVRSDQFKALCATAMENPSMSPERRTVLAMELADVLAVEIRRTSGP